jgi:hypothetical protein
VLCAWWLTRDQQYIQLQHLIWAWLRWAQGMLLLQRCGCNEFAWIPQIRVKFVKLVALTPFCAWVVAIRFSLSHLYIWSYSMHDESRILDMTPLRPQYRLNLILSQSRLNPCYFFHFFCINEFIIEQEGRLPFANDFHGTGVVVLLGHLHYSWDLSWIELPLSHPAGPSGHLSRLSFFFFLLKLACVRIYSLLVCK